MKIYNHSEDGFSANQYRQQNHKRVLSRSISALLISGLMATTAQAGIITSVPSASGADGFGGWNLDNIEVILNGTQGAIGSLDSWFDESDGSYNFAPDSDLTYFAEVDDGAGTIMGHALAKDWPVGEPSGIKIVNDDMKVKAPKPTNCIMATSYLADHFLDSADPQQVTCSGPFQSHKRYKLAMLPPTIDGAASESVDLLFNVEVEAGSRDYQVFQKINNWTDGRLEGFSIQVGFGVGAGFQTIADAGVSIDDLHLTVPSAIWSATQLANFSEGLFGPFDDHTETIGFFDPAQRAGFLIDEFLAAPLTSVPTDTLHATTTLGSDYAEIPPGSGLTNQFGSWVPDSMLPYGVFFDDDGNPETDAQLLAWYGFNPDISALGWMGGSQDSDGPFSAIPDAEIEAMGENLSFTMGEIDDLVNVGLNYIVTVGDVSTFPGTTFTIRITPTADTSGIADPDYVGAEPDPLLLFRSQDADVLLEPVGTFFIGDLLTARVGDSDLNTDPLVAEEVDVAISSDSGLNGTLTLVEQGENRGVFAASLPDEYSNVPAGTVVTMTYEDADIGDGSSETKMSSTTAVTPPEYDLGLDSFTSPVNIVEGKTKRLTSVISNGGPDIAEGTITVVGESDGFEDIVFSEAFGPIAPGSTLKQWFDFTAPAVDSRVAILWTATVEGEGDTTSDNDTATGNTNVNPVSDEYDLGLDSFTPPANIVEGKTKRLTSIISNGGPDIAEGTITVVGERSDGQADITFSEAFGPITSGSTLKQWFDFTAPAVDSRVVVDWTATVEGFGDITPDNNTAAGTTNVNSSD